MVGIFAFRVLATLPETHMETQIRPYKDYSPSKRGVIGVSMLVWGSVEALTSRSRIA